MRHLRQIFARDAERTCDVVSPNRDNHKPRRRFERASEFIMTRDAKPIAGFFDRLNAMLADNVQPHVYRGREPRRPYPRRSSPRAGGVRRRTRRRRRHRNPGPPAPVRRPFERRKVAWLQVTRLALSARVDGEKLSGWVHDITPAKLLAPVPGVTTALVVERRVGGAASAVSDAVGHVAFNLPLPSKSERERQRTRRARPDVGALLVATAGADSTFVALDDCAAGANARRSPRWYVTDDRFHLGPGERATSRDGSVGPTMA